MFKIISVYAAIASTAAVAFLVVGAARSRTPEITAERINIVEPDGTLRLVLANRARLPGVIVKGKEQPKQDRPQAGMIFLNDEGSETGGLIFGGRKDTNGNVLDSGGSLSFDRYGASEVVQLAGVHDSHDKFAGLAVSDERRRLWAGRTAEGNVAVELMDAHGAKRAVLQVTPEGAASLSFLDRDGRVTRRIGPE